MSFFFIGITKSEKLYVSKFDNFTIKCPYKSKINKVTWSGPPNMTPYSSNGKVNDQVKGIDIIEDNENGESSLVIYGFNESKDGAYQCVTVNEGIPVNKDFILILQNSEWELHILTFLTVHFNILIYKDSTTYQST